MEFFYARQELVLEHPFLDFRYVFCGIRQTSLKFRFSSFKAGEKPHPFKLETCLSLQPLVDQDQGFISTSPSFINACLSILIKKEKINSRYGDHLVNDKQHERPNFPCESSRKSIILDKYMLLGHALNIMHYFPLSNYKSILHWCAKKEILRLPLFH